jgi:hypothetical protein
VADEVAGDPAGAAPRPVPADPVDDVPVNDVPVDDLPVDDVPVPDQRPSAGRRRRGPLWAALVVTATVAVGGAAVVSTSSGGDVDPERALRQAQEALADAESYRMTITTESSSGDVTSAGPGSMLRTVDEVEVAGDDWHSLSDGGDWVTETILADGVVFTRFGDPATPVADEQWDQWPAAPGSFVDADDMTWIDQQFEILTAPPVEGDVEVPPEVEDELIEEMLVSVAGGLYLGGLGDPTLASAAGGGAGLGAGFGPFGGPTVDPVALATGVGELDGAEVIADDGGRVTIRAVRRAPERLVEAAGRPVPDGEFEVVVDEHDRLVSLHLTVEGSTARFDTLIEFRDWGADVTITAPTDVDPTPWLEEEAIADARAGITPVRPTVLPDGIEMQDIYPITAEESDDGCTGLELVYGPPLPPVEELDDPAAVAEAMEAGPDGYLAVTLQSVGCATAADRTPFAPGAYGEVPTREGDFGVEMLVGDTVATLDTTFTAELPAMVASIEPFDLDAELARLAEYAEAMRTTGGFVVTGGSL